MAYNSDYLDDFFIVFWLALFVLTLIIELKLKHLSLINYSFAALVTSLCGAIFAYAQVQLIIFISLSLLFAILLSPLKRKNRTKRIFENQVCAFIGREATVIKKIDPQKVGQIKFYDMTWEAIPANNCCIEVGEEVLITGKSGLNLIVTKINPN